MAASTQNSAGDEQQLLDGGRDRETGAAGGPAEADLHHGGALDRRRAEANLKAPGGATVPARNPAPGTPMRLLLIEDDDILGEGLRDYLRADGHAVDWCRSLADAERAARRALRRPAGRLAAARRLGPGLAAGRAARGDTTPALMLTARDRLGDRIAGPGRRRRRLPRQALRARGAGGPAARRRPAPRRRRRRARCAFGPVAVDLGARSAGVEGRRVELTAREWAVLEALVLRAGRIVPKADLERLVLGFDAEVASNALEVHVSALRRKLGRELIETVRGLGYRIGGAA